MPPVKLSYHSRQAIGVSIIGLLLTFGLTSLAYAQSAALTSTNSATSAPNIAATPSLLRPTELAIRLRQGGYLIVMRHEPPRLRSREDDYSKPLSDCLSQRNLSVAGYTGASETGEAMRIANVPIARI